VWRYALHRDHILPKFKGGTDDPSNIQLLCANCHEDKTREDFLGCGTNGMTGKRHTAETCARIRAALNRPDVNVKLGRRYILPDAFTDDALPQAATGSS